MNDVVFEIEGMHCDGCARTIDRALTRIEGVRDSQASFEGKRVHVWYDSRLTNTAKLAARIGEIGYQVVGDEIDA